MLNKYNFHHTSKEILFFNWSIFFFPTVHSEKFQILTSRKGNSEHRFRVSHEVLICQHFAPFALVLACSCCCLLCVYISNTCMSICYIHRYTCIADVHMYACMIYLKYEYFSWAIWNDTARLPHTSPATASTFLLQEDLCRPPYCYDNSRSNSLHARQLITPVRFPHLYPEMSSLKYLVLILDWKM